MTVVELEPASKRRPKGRRKPVVAVAQDNGDLVLDRRGSTDRRGPLRPEKLTPSRARIHGRALSLTFRAGDTLLLAIFAASGLLAEPTPTFSITLASGLYFLMPLWALLSLRAYAFRAGESLIKHLARVIAAFGLTALAIWATTLFGAQLGASPAPLFAAGFGAVLLLHAFAWAVVRKARADGKLTSNIVIVGTGRNAERLIEAALAGGDVAILGVFDDRLDRAPRTIHGVPVLGTTETLIDHKVMPFVDKIVIAVPEAAQARVRQIIERLSVLPNPIALFIDDGDAARPEVVSRVAGAPLAYVSGGPNDIGRAALKRGQDIVVGLAALFIALPIMAATALAVRLDSPGPILFRQRRHGFNNEEIVVWKFRSMRVEASDAKAARQVSAGDDRVTRVGRFIRATSLDELPQIFNVLKGEMSLVGPRPHAIGMMTGEVESHRLVSEYAHRHRMKPGMTGWAAIHGSRGPVDTPALVRERVALDVAYIERQSFWLDLYIMAMTIPCLLGDSRTVR